MHVVKEKNKRSPYSNLNNQKFVNKRNSNKNTNGKYIVSMNKSRFTQFLR